MECMESTSKKANIRSYQTIENEKDITLGEEKQFG